MPLVVVDFDAGFAVLPGTNNADSKAAPDLPLPSRFRDIGDGKRLLAAIEDDA